MYKCVQPGTLVVITLEQSGLTYGAHGYQACVYFDPEVLEFVSGDYSHYDCWDPNTYPITPAADEQKHIILRGFFCDPNRVDDSDAIVATLRFAALNVDTSTRVGFCEGGSGDEETAFLNIDWETMPTTPAQGVDLYVDNQPPEFICLEDDDPYPPGSPEFTDCLDCCCLPDPNVACIEGIPDPATTIEEFKLQGGDYEENVEPYYCEVSLQYLGQETLADGVGCESDPYVIRRFYQITDGAGLTDCGYQTITVIDDIPPAGSPPDPIQVECLDALPDCVNTCDGLVALGGSCSDNCPWPDGPNNVRCEPDDLSELIGGCGTVWRTYILTDACGNEQRLNPQAITVFDDEAPTLTCPSEIEVGTDPNVCTTVVALDCSATDNCVVTGFPQIIYWIDDPNAPIDTPYTFDVGVTIVHVKAIDGCGNESPTSDITVTVRDDEAPVFLPTVAGTTYCWPAEAVPAEEAELDPAALDPNCATWVVMLAPDPQYESPPGADMDWSALLPWDNCDANPTYTCDPPLGTFLEAGHVAPVRCTVTDAADNSATCCFHVYVYDAPPCVRCPGSGCDPNATPWCPLDNCPDPNWHEQYCLNWPTEGFDNDPEQCSAVVTFAACAWDDLAPVVTLAYAIESDPNANPDVFDQTIESPYPFPVGTTAVRATASDGASQSYCDFDVLVNDVEKPVRDNCPTNILADPNDHSGCHARVWWDEPTFTDNCEVVEVWSNHSPGDIFPVGDTAVFYRASDAANNKEWCNFTVTVVDPIGPTWFLCPPPEATDLLDPNDPNSPPTIRVYLAPGATEREVYWTTGFATDNCGEPTIWCSEQPGDVFPVGQWPVTCRAYDNAGNVEECVFWIDVVDENRLYVEVELALTPPAVSPLRRCIEFELSNCNDPEVPRATTRGTLTFVDGFAQGSVTVKAGNYNCISAKDTLHSLRRVQPNLTIDGNHYSATFKDRSQHGGVDKSLIQGDMDNDNLIDIRDYHRFVEWWDFDYQTVGGDTPCSWNCPGDPNDWPCGSSPCPCRHVDINGDGIVWTEDFLYVFVNFLATGEEVCCPEELGAPDSNTRQPLASITVAELVAEGNPNAARADLNGDGVLDANDIAALLMGARPEPRPDATEATTESRNSATAQP